MSSKVAVPVRLIVSDSGFNFVFLDDEQEDMEGEALEQLLDALQVTADARGIGTHVLTVCI